MFLFQVGEDGLLEGFLTGFLMVCENYQERSPHSKVRPEDDQMLMAMAMAKMATKQQLNEMVRKLLDEHKGGAKPAAPLLAGNSPRRALAAHRPITPNSMTC